MNSVWRNCSDVRPARNRHRYNSPWWDEGVLADPAYNLGSHGFLGSTVLSPVGHPRVRQFVGYDTYWTMPLYLVTLAGWIKLVGFSVLSVRFLSVLCGAGLIGAGYIIVRKLTGSIFASLIATDTVLLSAATARMDTMTAVFGYASLAAYLSFRERSLNKAVLFGTICAAGSLFAHPV